MKKKKPATWAAVKVGLDRMDRSGLVGVIRDLYHAGELNRRFLHARFVTAAPVLDEYRRLVRAAVFPDPFSQRPIRLTRQRRSPNTSVPLGIWRAQLI
jgi:hypothetical protein